MECSFGGLRRNHGGEPPPQPHCDLSDLIMLIRDKCVHQCLPTYFLCEKNTHKLYSNLSEVILHFLFLLFLHKLEELQGLQTHTFPHPFKTSHYFGAGYCPVVMIIIPFFLFSLWSFLKAYYW